jgi:hypothetical protein
MASNSSGSSLATSTRVLRTKAVNYGPSVDVSILAEERPKKPRVATTANSKRKCDHYSDEDDSDEDDDDSDEDDDDPPPPKKSHCRKPDNELGRIKKRIKAAVLKVLSGMLESNDELLASGSFVDKHWEQLFNQRGDLGNDDKFASELLLSASKWRHNLLGHARDLVDPDRNGIVSHRAANSALGRGENAPFIPTIDLSVEALGHFVNTMEQRRKGNDDFVPHPDVAACFPIGDMDLAMEYALLEHDSW